jgi:PAS domain S-box-containing protein
MPLLEKKDKTRSKMPRVREKDLKLAASEFAPKDPAPKRPSTLDDPEMGRQASRGGVPQASNQELSAVKEELRNQNLQLTIANRLLEQAHDGVIVRDEESRVISWNRGAERMYGWTKDEALGKITHVLLKTEFPEPLEQVERKLKATGAWEGELLHTTRRGKRIIVVSRWVLHRNEYGLPFAVLEINRDITEQKRAQEAQRANEERFRLLVDQVRDYAIFMLDVEGYVQTWNSGAERIKGYRAAEIIGKHFSCFYPPKDIQAGKPAHGLKVAVLEGRYEDEGWRVRKDGSKFWANVVITALHDSSGNLSGFAKVTRDKTDHKRAEESLSRLSGRLLKLQDEERRRIARELHDSTSQTLSALALNLSLLQLRTSQLDSEVLKTVSEAVRLADQASNEVRNISHLLHPPDLDEVGLTAAIQWHVRKFTERTGLHVDVQLPPRFQRLNSEQELTLFRVLQEGLTNVHRHSGSSTARVQLALHRGNVVLQIEDTGHGMPTGTLDLDDGDFGSVNIGVGIRGMRERIRQLGGQLEIRSNRSGTCVTAILPLEEVKQNRTVAGAVGLSKQFASRH